MPRLILGAVIVVAVFTVFTLVDCLRLERARVRAFPRVLWFFIVLLVPIVGAVLWYLVGRGSRRLLDAPASRTVGPDDDPDFLRRMGSAHPSATPPVSEERMRELEQSLAEADDDQDHGPADR